MIRSTHRDSLNAGIARLQKVWSELYQALQTPVSAVVTLRLTALMLIFYGEISLIQEVFLTIFCGVLLLAPRLLNTSVLWLLITAIFWLINAQYWLELDNHKFLMGYWCTVCVLALSSTRPRRVFAQNAHKLLGLVFLLATVWKLWAGEYLNGSFFHYTLLVDSRLEDLAHLLGNLSRDALTQNYLIQDLGQWLSGSDALYLNTTPQLRVLAQVLSYWTLFIEAILSIAFLVPVKFLLGRWRNGLLIIFIATTYFAVPVLGFAYLLVIMGLAQTQQGEWRARLGYLSLLIVLQLWRLPWLAKLDSLIS
ncbi:MAG: hypothetical protein AAGG02_00430 [Cyanobacteria bacterium P01_H01_bin.15]